MSLVVTDLGAVGNWAGIMDLPVFDELDGVAGACLHEAWAVGRYIDDGTSRVLIEHAS